MTSATATPLAASRRQLWMEFFALFLGVPVLMAVFFGQYSLFAVVWLLAGVAAGLLMLTPGWEWRMLWQGPVFARWRMILFFWLGTASVSTAVVFAIDPDLFLSFALSRPEFWLIVMIAYPIASAWPQELIYRSLFFERYGGLVANPTLLIALNGLVFGLGHLFYMNWITIAMTAFGGAFMGWAYLRDRSMPLAWVLHALAGQIVFTAGLGRFFYHGAVN